MCFHASIPEASFMLLVCLKSHGTAIEEGIWKRRISPINRQTIYGARK